MLRPTYSTMLSTSFSLLLPLLLLLPNYCVFIGYATTHSSSNLPPSETETLFKIMDLMSSDHSWRLSYPNPCSPDSLWPGIQCKLGLDNHFHVSRLDFGTYPNPSCKKTATFPSHIFALPYLHSLFFFNCFTRTKTTISISPFGLSNSSLQQLSLRSNPALVGPIPPLISSLKSLQILTLSQNSLFGSIPVGIFSLTSLVHLDFSYNKLSGPIPFQLGHLKNLVDLDFSYNSLTGKIPSTIGQLSKLQKLDFSSNSLIGTIPDTIEKLTSLNFLALSNNKLRGYCPTGLFKLQSLQYFIMDDNPMYTTLPVELGNLVKLQELRLANSGYFGSIPPSLSLLMNLSTLSLQNNRLSGQIPSGFSLLSHIYHLNLSKNLLEGVVPLNASFFRRLGKNLDLSGNQGLCLNPSEAYNVKLGNGVSVCSSSKNGSLITKSEATNGFYNYSFMLISVLFVHGSYLILLLTA